MAIVIFSDIENIDQWIDALKKEDPSVDVIKREEIKDNTFVEFALTWNYPHGLFREYPSVKTIMSMGAGVDHLVNDPLLPENINIVRIIDPTLSQDMFEFALAVIMNRLRMLTHFHENQRQKIWKRKRYQRISDVSIGVMGTGVIGNHIATQLHKTGFRVSGWSRTRGGSVPYNKFHGPFQLDDFLRNTDILICLLPLTPATEGILNRKNLETLPPGSWLINLGRGGHLVDGDLIELLDSNHLAGACLDVFREEPLPADHPFWSHPGINITPHIASLPHPSSVASQIIENYRRTLDNRPLINIADRKRGY